MNPAWTLVLFWRLYVRGPGRMLRDQLKNLDVATLPRETP